MKNRFYSLRNDYMFHAVLQESEQALRGLVSALIGVDPDGIRSCTIENPIILGEHIDEKTTILDVKLLLNDAERINVEVQVEKEGIWTDRSLLYWARLFLAGSWAELERLAAEKEVYQEVVVTMKRLTAEERVQMEMEAREDYERRMSSQYNYGHRNGLQEGLQKGDARIAQLNQLYGRLMDDNRLDDLRRAMKEPVYQQELLKEFGL